jgi:hypothetical protein
MLIMLMLTNFNLPLNDEPKKKKYANKFYTNKCFNDKIKSVCGGNRIFSNLNEALSIQSKLKGAVVLVAFDVHKDGAKNWCFFNERKDLFNFINVNYCCPLYEQINPIEHKLYFDVDLEEDEDVFDTFDFENYKQQLEAELLTILNNNLIFVWLNSSSPKKHSYHLIVNGLCSNSQNKQIKNYLNKKLGNMFLDEVYSQTRCLRMWNCSKLGQNRPLKIIGKHKFNETLVNLYDENIELINPNIVLKEAEPVKLKVKYSNNEWVPVPDNKYLLDNFTPSKYQVNVYVRNVHGFSLACPICLSTKQLLSMYLRKIIRLLWDVLEQNNGMVIDIS